MTLFRALAHQYGSITQQLAPSRCTLAVNSASIKRML